MTEETKKVDYQKTLNLPQTDFSMKAGLTQKEPELLKQWESKGVYAEMRKEAKGRKTFILHDGPPYANGNIHIGHALNKILKDFIVKMKSMQGFDSLYIPGWDCHGLPIEHQLFKELKKRKSEVDSVEFRKKAHDYAMKFVGTQREQFKRLGIFGQWDNPYLTLSPEYEYWILHSFGRLVEKDFVYRGLKPVNWCAQDETALAEAEVEYENHTSPSVYVKFEVENPQVLGIKGLPKDRKVYLLIWTTTPWTLLANVAVAVNASFKYAVVELNNEIYILEEEKAKGDLLFKGASFPTGWPEKASGPVEIVDGKVLTKLIYKHPFGILKNCRVITADYVSKDDGTGLVHIAPGHGQEDFEAGRANNLDVLVPVDERGIFTKEAGAFAGQYVFKANPNIIEDLKNRRILFYSENITHSYPHCWRCKSPVIFRATKQWFLKIDHDGLRGKLRDIIKRDVRWIPEAGQERILGMVVGRPDWCLSRQRHWGVPIPALKCKGCDGEHRLFPEVVENFAKIVRKEGSNAWFTKDLKEIVPSNFVCPHCKKSDFEKTFDILDVWFDSGVSHQAVVAPMMQSQIPVDMYLEGSDQHRGWFQSSLIPAVALEGKAPFKGVLTHGFVVDGQGRKMSKSLGNVIAPDDIIKNSGADILRLWVAASSYEDDVRLSKEILDRLVDAYRKIRNTFRYILGNVYDYDPAKNEVPYNRLLELDQLALYKLNTCIDTVKENYNSYQFAKVYKTIYSFCNEDLSGFYLDILKDRLYTSPANSPERRSAQTVLYHILNHFVRLLAPILSFTAEEIFAIKKMEDVQSVHLLPWLDTPNDWKNSTVDEKFKLLIELRPFVMKALEDKRTTGGIGSSLEAKVIFRTASERDFQYLSNFQKLLPAFFIVSQVGVEQVKVVEQGLNEQFAKTQVFIEKADGAKCSRCWNYTTHVGEDPEHPTLCERCAPIVRRIL